MLGCYSKETEIEVLEVTKTVQTFSNDICFLNDLCQVLKIAATIFNRNIEIVNCGLLNLERNIQYRVYKIRLANEFLVTSYIHSFALKKCNQNCLA